jgi:hypothetical protein
MLPAQRNVNSRPLPPPWTVIEKRRDGLHSCDAAKGGPPIAGVGGGGRDRRASDAVGFPTTGVAGSFGIGRQADGSFEDAITVSTMNWFTLTTRWIPGALLAENKDARLHQTLPNALRDLSPLPLGAVSRPA